MCFFICIWWHIEQLKTQMVSHTYKNRFCDATRNMGLKINNQGARYLCLTGKTEWMHLHRILTKKGKMNGDLLMEGSVVCNV